MVTFRLNGKSVHVTVEPHYTLLRVLRDVLGDTSVKYGCGEGVCGTCTVLLNGESVSSCLILAPQVEGAEVTTVRGLLNPDGSLSDLQDAFWRHGAVQCGFCTPGMILTAWEFLRDHPNATRDEIRQALAGNLCRCTGYTKIIDAVEECVRTIIK
jgi:aerobic-type carbon monoxide dehydrogenase small subunit (CoxS/CutS family)